jgi:hypothetical protein
LTDLTCLPQSLTETVVPGQQVAHPAIRVKDHRP